MLVSTALASNLVPLPNEIDPTQYVAALARAVQLLRGGTDLHEMAEVLRRLEAVNAPSELVAALDARIRNGVTIRIMLAQARIEAAGRRASRTE